MRGLGVFRRHEGASRELGSPDPRGRAHLRGAPSPGSGDLSQGAPS
ncbi:unnamed protein product [Gulo gulo]|uniref:Uncharacterized protein n=1 Tax=Gulo gulo TaxID=48420 RepID=A0A9X9M7B5_GULGU|nr:unnamed protein product [Gulo gulo]